MTLSQLHKKHGLVCLACQEGSSPTENAFKREIGDGEWAIWQCNMLHIYEIDVTLTELETSAVRDKNGQREEKINKRAEKYRFALSRKPSLKNLALVKKVLTKLIEKGDSD